jgi:hypothetical protein
MDPGVGTWSPGLRQQKLNNTSNIIMVSWIMTFTVEGVQGLESIAVDKQRSGDPCVTGLR